MFDGQHGKNFFLKSTGEVKEGEKGKGGNRGGVPFLGKGGNFHGACS